MSQIKVFQGQAEPEGHETTTAAVARKTVQCTDTTEIMNHEDFITYYTNCEKEKSYEEEKSELVPPPIAVDFILYKHAWGVTVVWIILYNRVTVNCAVVLWILFISRLFCTSLHKLCYIIIFIRQMAHTYHDYYKSTEEMTTTARVNSLRMQTRLL